MFINSNPIIQSKRPSLKSSHDTEKGFFIQTNKYSDTYTLRKKILHRFGLLYWIVFIIFDWSHLTIIIITNGNNMINFVLLTKLFFSIHFDFLGTFGFSTLCSFGLFGVMLLVDIIWLVSYIFLVIGQDVLWLNLIWWVNLAICSILNVSSSDNIAYQVKLKYFLHFKFSFQSYNVLINLMWSKTNLVIIGKYR